MAVRKIAWAIVVVCLVIFYFSRRLFFRLIVEEPGIQLPDAIVGLVAIVAFVTLLQFLKLTDARTGDRPWVPSEDEMDDWENN